MSLVCCPVQDCQWENSLKRVLAHIRDFHKIDECPEEFICEYGLQQCPRCSKWFLKLQRHLSGSTCSTVRIENGDDVGSDGDFVAAPSSSGLRDDLHRSRSVSSGSLVSDHDRCHLDVESEAWRFIDALPVEDILNALPPRSIRRIPSYLRSLFQECCKIPLRKIEEEPSNDTGWKLLMLLPRMLLQPHARGGKVGNKEVKARYQCFLNFHWKDMVQLNAFGNRGSKSNALSDDGKRRLAVRLIQSGEISKAARILTSQGLAPETDEVLQKLKSKHPVEVITPDEIPVDLRSSSSLSSPHLGRATFTNIIKSAPKGSGCGPSGWRYEHIQVIFYDDNSADLLYTMSNHIALGNVPSKIVPLLSGSRLIALPKSNGDVRPIAIGEVFRRVTTKLFANRNLLIFLLTSLLYNMVSQRLGEQSC